MLRCVWFQQYIRIFGCFICWDESKIIQLFWKFFGLLPMRIMHWKENHAESKRFFTCNDPREFFWPKKDFALNIESNQTCGGRFATEGYLLGPIPRPNRKKIDSVRTWFDGESVSKKEMHVPKQPLI
jgi:hypothetical protein